MNNMQILCMDAARETGEPIFRTPCSVGSGEYPTLPEPYDGVPHHEGLGIVDAFTADQMRSYIDADRARRVGALSAHEQRAVLNDLTGLECLINYHDCCEAGADAMEPGAGNGNARRALELLAIGRAIITRDPEIWTDEQKRVFALRHSERAIAAATEGAV